MSSNRILLGPGRSLTAPLLLSGEGGCHWTLSAVGVPDLIDEAAAGRRPIDTFNIQTGAGPGPLAGRTWRVGLMGDGSARRLMVPLPRALGSVLAAQDHPVHV